MSRVAVFAATLVMLAAASTGCNQTPMVSDHCFIMLVAYAPLDTTLHAGDTLTMHATLLPPAAACLPGVTVADLRWRAQGASVVVIDSLTGHLTAVGSGTGSVGVFVGTSPTTIGNATVHVVP